MAGAPIMDETNSTTSNRSLRPAWRDWRWLLLLLALVVPVRGWLLINTEVMARDSIGFIRYALLFDQEPWGHVVRSIEQHPGYPFTIWLASLPARAWVGDLTPEIMQF